MRTKVVIQFYAQLTFEHEHEQQGTRAGGGRRCMNAISLFSVAFIQYQNNFQFATKIERKRLKPMECQCVRMSDTD